MSYWYAGAAQSGSTLTLDLTDPGLLYGATVFTTLRVYAQSLDHPLTQWHAHRDRLHRSLSTLNWCPPDWASVEQGAVQMAATWPVLRVTLFPDGRELIIGRSLPPNLAHQQTQGITAWVADAALYQRWAPTEKTGNYLPAWLAQRSAQAQAADLAILTDAAGNWVETATGNLWGWAEGTWYTPPVNTSALPGISRQWILEWLQRRGQVVQERIWHPGFVEQLAAIAHSNSVIQVVPIHTVLRNQQAPLQSRNHSIHQDLSSAFCEMGGRPS